MTSSPPHLIIEEGPEKGRELVIPAEGARLGRATENDLTILDAAMSRFQCRLYFRDGFLHIMDLGSTNETLVNNRPVSDQALRYGDEILIGESLIKVINDGLSTSERAAPGEDADEPEPAPIVFQPDAPEAPKPKSAPRGDKQEPAAAPIPETKPAEPAPAMVDVDLGLGRRDEEEPESGEPRKSNIPQLLVILITMLVVLGIGSLVLFPPESQAPAAPQPQDSTLRLSYEKVKAGDGNIFRYAVELEPDGTLSGRVNDLRNQVSIDRSEKIDPERLKQFKEQILNQQDVFLTLQNEYEGIPVGEHESYDLTVIIGREAKSIRVANQLEPDAFKQMREQIEAFAGTALNLTTHNIPPEELRARAERSWDNARKLYQQREVKNANLWEAIQKLKDVIFLLDAIEPKPEYYRQAVELRQVWMRDLKDKLRDLNFEAVRAYNVGDIQRSAELYSQILATMPDKTSSTYKQAYNTLVSIEQELNR